MQVGLYLLLVLHIAEGCKLKDGKQEKITAYTGGSALLPCYCTDPQATPGRFTWKKLSTGIVIWEEMSSESGQYRDRVQLGNGHSPGNLSLLISLLTEEDRGWHRCDVEGSIKDIRLTVEGCSLTNYKTTLNITAHTGGLVLLPCSCTELRAKPKTFSWNKYISPNWDRITFESGQYRDRFQLFNGHSPGNLSLLISHLTEGDGGDYRCHLESGYTDIRLTVKAPTLRTSTLRSSTMSSHEGKSTLNVAAGDAEPHQSLPFVPFALVTVIFLHIIVAVVYHTKRNKVPDAATIYYSNDEEDGAVIVQ
uniref:Ig-like domain-containing protein n=1 Tax=Pygocentrus nattereri TaxID=42514 RepID=A0AAR2IQT7_PYGNA